ncbi:peptidase M15 [Rhizobiales bacterium RZME27]|uniref:Peptidase M15 n=2 Tax=Endobacterium cereale TaxID=2663029 RepID=A0A6A8AG73_9HYPH|nr:D-alanyl-D-alanine carboxypeptidase [Endobacterium cereale]MQY49824.1 peptidase M15 [Endobacterium cereale]
MISVARSRLLYIVAGLFFAALSMSANAARAGYAHFIVDANSGEVFAAENADVLNHPASLTKMMTLYLAFEAIRQGRLSWEQQIIMTPNAAEKIPYKLGIGAGKPLTVREAAYATAIRSANDAAQAIGDHLGGGEEGFARMMTLKARALGMRSTVFRNASGLPDDAQVTTARDMAVLAAALIRDYPQEYRIFSERSFNFRGRTIRGHNNLMYRYAGMDGVKTGYVNASGFNLVSAVNENGRRIIGVVMGGKTARSRDAQMEALLDRALGREALVAGAETKRPAAGVAAALDNVPMPFRNPSSNETVAQTKLANRQASSLPGVTRSASVPALALGETSRSAAQDGIAGIVPSAPGAAVVSADPKGWRVQIAAAGNRSTASRLLTRAQAILSDHFGSVAPLINEATNSSGSAMYRAQLIGFGDRKGAMEACSALQQYSVECFVLQGSG